MQLIAVILPTAKPTSALPLHEWSCVSRLVQYSAQSTDSPMIYSVAFLPLGYHGPEVMVKGVALALPPPHKSEKDGVRRYVIGVMILGSYPCHGGSQ